MHIDFSRSLLIFTDGASSGNPGPGGWGAVLVFPLLDEVVELGGSKLKTTNNEMELHAVIGALSYAINNTSETHVFSDSKYVIEGITRWIKTWERNGWKTQTKNEVANRVAWESLARLVGEREQSSNIVWHYVPGHSGIPGNERCDEIATSYTKGLHPKLYRGRLSAYPIQVLSFGMDVLQKEKKDATKKRAQGKAYSYLSLVGGVPMRHETWNECEARVRGVANVKYKKSFSEKDERDILKSWGIDPRVLPPV